MSTDLAPWAQPAIAFVLLDRSAPDPAEVAALLTSVFAGSAPIEPADEESTATSVRLNDAVVLAQPVDGPTRGGEASRHARDLAIWNGNETVIESHQSHIVVTSVRLAESADEQDADKQGAGGESTDDDRGNNEGADSATLEELDPRVDALRRELAVAQVAAALTTLEGVIAVHIASAAATLPAEPYRSMVAGNPLPVPALIGVRAGWQSEGVSCVYTSGLERFGHREMEWREIPGHPGQAYGQMCDLVAFALGTGTVISPGQRLEIAAGVQVTVAEGTSPLTGLDVLQLSLN